MSQEISNLFVASKFNPRSLQALAKETLQLNSYFHFVNIRDVIEYSRTFYRHSIEFSSPSMICYDRICQEKDLWWACEYFVALNAHFTPDDVFYDFRTSKWVALRFMIAYYNPKYMFSMVFENSISSIDRMHAFPCFTCTRCNRIIGSFKSSKEHFLFHLEYYKQGLMQAQLGIHHVFCMPLHENQFWIKRVFGMKRTILNIEGIFRTFAFEFCRMCGMCNHDFVDNRHHLQFHIDLVYYKMPHCVRCNKQFASVPEAKQHFLERYERKKRELPSRVLNIVERKLNALNYTYCDVRSAVLGSSMDIKNDLVQDLTIRRKFWAEYKSQCIKAGMTKNDSASMALEVLRRMKKRKIEENEGYKTRMLHQFAIIATNNREFRQDIAKLKHNFDVDKTDGVQIEPQFSALSLFNVDLEFAVFGSKFCEELKRIVVELMSGVKSVCQTIWEFLKNFNYLGAVVVLLLNAIVFLIIKYLGTSFREMTETLFVFNLALLIGKWTYDKIEKFEIVQENMEHIIRDNHRWLQEMWHETAFDSHAAQKFTLPRKDSPVSTPTKVSTVREWLSDQDISEEEINEFEDAPAPLEEPHLPTILHQGLVDDGKAFWMLFGGILGFKPTMAVIEKFVAFAQCSRVTATLLSSWRTIIDLVMNLGGKFYVWMCASEMERDLMNISKYRDRIIAATQEIDELSSVGNKLLLYTTEHLQERTFRLRQEMEELLTATQVNPVSVNYLRSTLSAQMVIVRELVSIAERGKMSSDVRLDPYCIWLCGQPGLGKSTSIRNLVAFLLRPYTKQISNLIYYRNALSKFHDNYAQQPAYCIDDFLSVAGEPATLNIGDLFGAKTPAEWMPPMAAVNDKGTPFKSKLMIITSNVTKPPIDGIAFDHDAVLRRRNIVWKMEPNAYHTEWFPMGAKYSPDMVKNVPAANRDANDHVLFQRYDPVHDIKIGSPVNWNQMKLITRREMAEYMIGQRRMLCNASSLVPAIAASRANEAVIAAMDDESELIDFDQYMEASFNPLSWREDLKATNPILSADADLVETWNDAETQLAFMASATDIQTQVAAVRAHREQNERNAEADIEHAIQQAEASLDESVRPTYYERIVKQMENLLNQMSSLSKKALDWVQTIPHYKIIAAVLGGLSAGGIVYTILYKLLGSDMMKRSVKEWKKWWSTAKIVVRRMRGLHVDLAQIKYHDKLTGSCSFSVNVIEDDGRAEGIYHDNELVGSFNWQGKVFDLHGNVIGTHNMVEPHLIQSGDSLTKGARKLNITRRANIQERHVGRIRAEGSADPNRDDMIRAVYPLNFYEAEITEDLYHAKMFAFGVVGRCFLLPKHFFHGRTSKAVITLTNGRGTFSENFRPEKLHTTKYESDVAIYEMGPCIHLQRKVLHCFIDDNHVGRVSQCYGVLTTIEREQFVFNHGRVKPLEQNISYDVNGKVAAVPNRRGWWFEGRTEPGQCGALLALGMTTIPGKFAGMHVGGDKNSDLGLSILVTRQLLEELIADCETADMTPALQYDAERDEAFTIDGTPVIIPASKCNFTYEGVLKPKFAPRIPDKTNITHSIIHGKIAEPVTAPAILNPKDIRCKSGVSPILKGIEKYGTPSPSFPLKYVELADAEGEAVILKSVKPQRVNIGQVDCKFILNGIIPDQKINMRTSVGWPHTVTRSRAGKHDKFDVLPDGEIIFKKESFNDFSANMTLLGQGELPMFRWTDMLKDERVKLEKIELEKTRVFTIPPYDFTLLMRALTLDFNIAFYASYGTFYSQVGMDPESFDWEKFLLRLEEMGDQGFDGDYGSFDGTLKNDCMWRCMTQVNTWYRKHAPNGITFTFIDRNETNGKKVKVHWSAKICDRARMLLCNDLIHTHQIAMNLSYQTHQGNPSGNPMTVIFNTMVDDQYVRAVYYELLDKEGILYDKESAFDNCVRTAIYGDDIVIVPAPGIAHWFNFDTVSQTLSRYGITFTPSHKGDKTCELKSLNEIRFLKRGTRVSEFGVRVPLMDLDTIHEMFNFVRAKTELEREEQSYVLIDNAFRFLFYYGRELFEEYLQRVNKSLTSLGYEASSQSYRLLSIEFQSKIA